MWRTNAILAPEVHQPSHFEGLKGWISFIIRIPKFLIQLKVDHDALIEAFNQKVQQDIELTNQTRELARRLAYYEENMPRMRDLRQHYEQEKMGIRKRNGSNLISLG